MAFGHGFLTGTIRSPEQTADDDWRRTNPRFTGEDFRHNLTIADDLTPPAGDHHNEAQLRMIDR